MNNKHDGHIPTPADLDIKDDSPKYDDPEKSSYATLFQGYFEIILTKYFELQSQNSKLQNEIVELKKQDLELKKQNAKLGKYNFYLKICTYVAPVTPIVVTIFAWNMWISPWFFDSSTSEQTEAIQQQDSILPSNE